MNTRTIRSQQDTSILSKSELDRIRSRSHPPLADTYFEDSKDKLSQIHEKSLVSTSNWKNSIANSRKDRMTRLQNESIQREAELEQYHLEEIKIQKENRKKLLAVAEEKALQDMPEVRDVNAQLLLKEVLKERQKQITIKERETLKQNRRDFDYDENLIKEIKQDEAKENQKKLELKYKKLGYGEVLKQQRIARQANLDYEKEREKEEENILSLENQNQVLIEQQNKLKQIEFEKARNAELRDQNEQLIRFKADQKKIEVEEDRRIAATKIEVMDEQFNRTRLDKQKRDERQAKVDVLIDRQAKHLSELNRQKTDFFDTQENLQFEKDRIAIEEAEAKQEQIRNERRADYLEAMKKKENEKKRKNPKLPYPDTFEEKPDLTSEKRENLKQIAAFQRQQTQEKKERDLAEKEKHKLEFLREIEIEDQTTAEAQEYAREMLLKVRSRKY